MADHIFEYGILLLCILFYESRFYILSFKQQTFSINMELMWFWTNIKGNHGSEKCINISNRL